MTDHLSQSPDLPRTEPDEPETPPTPDATNAAGNPDEENN